MTRVAVYARYSDDKQSPHSIDDQVRICRMHADKQGWRLVETYSDAAISGSTVILRPGVQALLRDALAGKFDLVLAEALDRLSRDQEDIAGLFKRLRFAGVPIVTLSEGEVSELHVGLKATMNALFLKDLAAKTHRGIRGRVEAGNMAKSQTSGAAAARRPRTLLSGLLICGVCGGSYAKRGNARFACVSHTMGKGCSNGRSIVRDRLEERVLVGLRDRLMTPEALAEAMRAFVEETNRLNHQRRATHEADVQRLEKALRAIGGLVAAIEDGGYSRPLMERLKALEVEVEEIERRLVEAPKDMPDIHPNVAELYRRKVAALAEALDRPEDRDAAAKALRGLIDRIVLTPGERRGEVHAELFGDLEALLAFAHDEGGQRRKAAGAFPVESLSLAVNARACVGNPEFVTYRVSAQA